MMPSLARRAVLHAAPFAMLWFALASPSARAEPYGHGSVAVGGFAAATGPQPYGLAAEIELYPARDPGRGPGFWPERLGARACYRGERGASPGMAALGVTFAAGEARPELVIGMHAELGVDIERSLPVAGAGVRGQLAIAPPLAVAASMTGHLHIDGIDTRLALAIAVTAGLAW